MKMKLPRQLLRGAGIPCVIGRARCRVDRLFSLVCATAIGLCNVAFAAPVDILWYTYADPASEYVSFYSSLGGNGPGSASTYPQSSGLAWNLTFFGPTSAAPNFANYDVLVIESGEAFRTNPPGGALATPNYSGVLNNKAAIEAARGNRTFVSGADADFHAVRGDSGLCPDVHCGNFDGARGYVINAVNWAAGGAGLGILSFYHGEFPDSFWWDDPNSFLKQELGGHWINFNPDENDIVIPAAAAHYATNQGLTANGLSDWFNSFHAGFSNVAGYVSTADSGSHAGFSVSLATIDLCQPSAGRVCLAVTIAEPSSSFLVACSLLLLVVARQKSSVNAPVNRRVRLRPVVCPHGRDWTASADSQSAIR